MFDFTHLFKLVDSKHETSLLLVSFVYFYVPCFWIPSPVSGVVYMWWLYWTSLEHGFSGPGPCAEPPIHNTLGPSHWVLATRDQSTALALSRIWDILSNEMIEAGSRLNLSPPWIANLSSNMCSPSSDCQNGFVSCFKATEVVIFYLICIHFSKARLKKIPLRVSHFTFSWTCLSITCFGSHITLFAKEILRVQEKLLFGRVGDLGWRIGPRQFQDFVSVKRGSEQTTECNLYMHLPYAIFVHLCLYMIWLLINLTGAHCFITRQFMMVLLCYKLNFLVYTLIYFWMVDNDFSPLSVNVNKSFRVSFSFRPVLGETPPTSGLGEVVK